MKILVTGGAGFIGSNFVRHWKAKYPQDEIVVLDKLTYAGRKENLNGLLESIHFVQGDICDKAVVRQVMAGVDVVVHFAAESHVDRSISGPEVFLKTNVLGTHVLLEAARSAGVKRFHHVSTDEVFGQIPLDSVEKFSENSPYQPRSPYSASKAAADHLVRAYGSTYGLPFTISNCSNNFGPYHFPEKLIPLAITNMLTGKKAPVYGQGLQVRDWLYVEDHCRAIDLILNKGEVGETYLIGGDGGEINNLEVVRRIARLLGKSEEESLEFVTDRPGHDAKYAVDCSKIKKELGFVPAGDFDARLKDTVQWYKENEAWWKPMKK